MFRWKNVLETIFRRHRWKRLRLLVSMLLFRGQSVCLSVCHVRALCSNGRIYRHHFFCVPQPISLQDRVKIWLTSVNNFVPKFCLEVTHPLLLSVSATFNGKLQQRHGHNGQPIGNHHCFSNGAIADPYDLPFLQMEVPNASQVQLLNACFHLAYMIEDIDKICPCYYTDERKISATRSRSTNFKREVITFPPLPTHLPFPPLLSSLYPSDFYVPRCFPPSSYRRFGLWIPEERCKFPQRGQ